MLQHEQLVAEKQAIELNVQKIDKKVEDAEDELKDIEKAYRDSVENHDRAKKRQRELQKEKLRLRLEKKRAARAHADASLDEIAKKKAKKQEELAALKEKLGSGISAEEKKKIREEISEQQIELEALNETQKAKIEEQQRELNDANQALKDLQDKYEQLLKNKEDESLERVKLIENKALDTKALMNEEKLLLEEKQAELTALQDAASNVSDAVEAAKIDAKIRKAEAEMAANRTKVQGIEKEYRKTLDNQAKRIENARSAQREKLKHRRERMRAAKGRAAERTKQIEDLKEAVEKVDNKEAKKELAMRLDEQMGLLRADELEQLESESLLQEEEAAGKNLAEEEKGIDIERQKLQHDMKKAQHQALELEAAELKRLQDKIAAAKNDQQKEVLETQLLDRQRKMDQIKSNFDKNNSSFEDDLKAEAARKAERLRKRRAAVKVCTCLPIPHDTSNKVAFIYCQDS